MQVLDKHKDKFTVDFTNNKKMLDQLAIIRSKGLKNEMAGFITKFVRHEKETKISKNENIVSELESKTEQIDEDLDESIPDEITVESNPE